MARRPEEGTDDVTRVQSTDRSDARGDQLAQAFEVIRQHDPSRIVTLGSECAVSVAPSPNSRAATATTSPSSPPTGWRWSGCTSGRRTTSANVAQSRIRAFSPDDLRATTQPLWDWLAATGCSAE